MAGYIFTFTSHPDGPTQFDPSGKISPPVDADAHNKQVEARELEAWKAQPDHMVGYYHVERPINSRYYGTWAVGLSGSPVTVRTWLGTALGHGLITGAHVNNFGGRIIRVRVLGTNGAEYWGAASYDAEIIRLHKVRS